MKKVWIAIAIIGIIAAIALIGAPYIKDWLANTNAKDEKTVEEQAKEALESVMNSTDLADEEPDELLVATESRSGYEVLSYSETDTGALVTFLVYAPDLYTVVKDIDENHSFETDEELRNALINATKEAPLVEREVTLEFSLVDGEYIPLLNFEFFDAYYGGIFKLLNESRGDMNEEEAK